MNKLEIAYFVDVVKNPAHKPIVYFDPYETLPKELLAGWSKEGRPRNWRNEAKKVSNRQKSA